jgi:type IV fimbrial biogenesis protein FimT
LAAVMMMLMKTPARRSRAGLTLLELMITLSIFAILASLAVPSFGARIAHGRLLRAAENLAGDITEARFEATRRGQPLFVQSAGSCWAISSAADCTCGAVQACQIHRLDLAEHPGVSLQGEMAVRLEPAGTALQMGAVTLRSTQGEQLRVEVSALGRPRICASSGLWPRLPVCQT